MTKIRKIFGLGMTVCFFIVCCLSLSEAANIRKLIIGKWIENNRNSLELVEDGTAIIVEEGKSLAGNYKFLPDGRLKIDLGGFWGSKVFEVSIDKEGCLNLKEPNGEVTKYLTEKAYRQEALKKASENYVIKVNSTVITQADLKREFEALPKYAQEMFRTEKGIFNLVEEFIKKHMIYQEAKKQNLEINSLLEREVASKVRVSDEEVKGYYEKNKAQFTEKGVPVEFDKVKVMLTQMLTTEKQKERFVTYVEKLKKSYAIDINKKAVEAFQENLSKK